MIPTIKGLRLKNMNKDEVTIYVTAQAGEDRIKFVVLDVTVRKYRTKTHRSINETVQSSYLYKCLSTDLERKECLAREYLNYVTEEEIEQALIHAWEVCKPELC